MKNSKAKIYQPPKIDGPLRPHSSHSSKAGTEHLNYDLCSKCPLKWSVCLFMFVVNRSQRQLPVRSRLELRESPAVRKVSRGKMTTGKKCLASMCIHWYHCLHILRNAYNIFYCFYENMSLVLQLLVCGTVFHHTSLLPPLSLHLLLSS